LRPFEKNGENNGEKKVKITSYKPHNDNKKVEYPNSTLRPQKIEKKEDEGRNFDEIWPIFLLEYRGSATEPEPRRPRSGTDPGPLKAQSDIFPALPTPKNRVKCQMSRLKMDPEICEG
jgi:hypothetical protein